MTLQTIGRPTRAEVAVDSVPQTLTSAVAASCSTSR